MGLELLELTPERVVGRMPVEGNTQPFGLWHGGASCVLAETLASIGAYAHASPTGSASGSTSTRPTTAPAAPGGSPARRRPCGSAASWPATRWC